MAAEGKRVVIVGGGFGGLYAAKALRGSDAEVTLVDRRNFHLFQPLLYQVATAALSPAQVAYPIRAIFRRQKNVAVILDEVTGIDTAGRRVLGIHGALPYDVLVLATGATHSWFGHDDWAPYAPGLKTIDDATEMRRRILDAFERAELTEPGAERDALLTFAIVGGGPTGVEMAGAIVELARRTLKEEFRRIRPETARVVLIEAGPRILAAMPEELSAKAERQLVRLGVQVRTRTAVTDCGPDGVRLGAEMLPTRTIVWAAGVAASPAARWLGAPADRAGRIQVLPDLTVPGHPEIFAIGDTVTIAGAGGKPVPGIAAAAKQMGRYVGRAIVARLAGRPAPPPFRYTDIGSLATIGRNAAVIDWGRVKLSGFVAWFLWAGAHVFFLIGFRNRFVVAMDWIWSYFTGGRSVRLITAPKAGAVEAAPPD